MLYLIRDDESVKVVEEPARYSYSSYAKIWAEIYADGSFDLYSPKPYLGDYPENDGDRDLFMEAYNYPEDVHQAVRNSINSIVPKARRIYFMEYTNAEGNHRIVDLPSEACDPESAEKVSQELLDTWSKGTSTSLQVGAVFPAQKGKESMNTMYLIQNGDTVELVEDVAWSSEPFIWAEIYKDGSFNFYEDYEKTYPKEITEDTPKQFFMRSHENGFHVFETLYDRLDDIVPEPKRIYFMEYVNSKGHQKRVELTDDSVVDMASAEKFGRELIDTWSQNGKYDLTFSSVLTDMKGRETRNETVMKLASLDMSDLEDLSDTQQL